MLLPLVEILKYWRILVSLLLEKDAISLVLGEEDGQVHNADIPVRWCISNKALDDLKDRGVLNPVILIAAFKGNNELSRQVLPISKVKTFLRFTKAGECQIQIWIVDGDEIKKGKLLGISLTNYYDEVKEDFYGDYVYGHYTEEVEIPEEAFGKEPPPLLKWYNNWGFPKKESDTCKFWQRLLIFGWNKWIIMLGYALLNTIGKIMIIFLYISFGYQKLVTINWLHLLHPFDYGAKYIVSEGEYLGFKRSSWAILVSRSDKWYQFRKSLKCDDVLWILVTPLVVTFVPYMLIVSLLSLSISGLVSAVAFSEVFIFFYVVIFTISFIIDLIVLLIIIEYDKLLKDIKIFWKSDCASSSFVKAILVVGLLILTTIILFILDNMMYSLIMIGICSLIYFIIRTIIKNMSTIDEIIEELSYRNVKNKVYKSFNPDPDFDLLKESLCPEKGLTTTAYNNLPKEVRERNPKLWIAENKHSHCKPMQM